MAPRKRKAADDGEDSAKINKTRRITRGMTTDASRKAVLNTTELLEEIFMHLPNKQVFASQRVCRQFRDLVQSSTRIREKLFLRRSQAEPQKWAIQEVQDPYFEWKKDANYVKHPELSGTDGKTYMPVRLNPLLQSKRDFYPHHGTAFQKRYNGIHMSLPFTTVSTNTDPSWKDAFLTDPPNKSARLYARWKSHTDQYLHGYIHICVNDDKGVTFSKIWDEWIRTKCGVGLGSISYRANTEEDWTDMHDTSLLELAQTLKKGTGKDMVVKVEVSYVRLDDVVVPTEEEWEAMK